MTPPCLLPLALLLQSAPPPSPFFSNDAAGVIKILVIVVAPIVLSIGAWVWKLARTDEREDIKGMGTRVTKVQEDCVRTATKLEGLERQMNEDRLTFHATINDRDKKLSEQMSGLREQLGRLDERLAIRNEIRDAVREAIREGGGKP